MPATALLRQLYANRESVIRATTRPGPPGFYGEGQNTPPGTDGAYMDAGVAGGQFMIHNQKGDAFSNLVSSYGGYSMDYHTAMTPPSSVSPRDKAMHTAGAATSAYEGYTSYANPEGPSLPLKPQAYPAMHGASLEAYNAIEQSQFYPHHGGFHLYHKGAPSTGWYTAPT